MMRPRWTRWALASSIGLLVVGIGGYAVARYRTVSSLEALADQIADEFDVPRAIFKAMVMAESSWRPRAKNCGGSDGAAGCAWGLLQFIPSTARSVGYTGPLDGLLDAETNLRLGGKLMGDYVRRFGTDVRRLRSAWTGGSSDEWWAEQANYRNALRKYGWSIA